MPKPKRVLCVMDLAFVGRSSMAVALPVLSACGAQPCPLPTALFSSHTGGFTNIAKQDEAQFCKEALDSFSREHIVFDAVYIGYLCSDEQIALAREIIERHPDALHIVDPAIGDYGRTYQGVGSEIINGMKGLTASADIITPNYTECALLASKMPSKEIPDEKQIKTLLSQLSESGRSVVITSIPAKDNAYVTAGCEGGGKNIFIMPSARAPLNYPGTGDAFASAFTGLTMAGLGFKEAVEKATEFVETACLATYEESRAINQSVNVRHGVWYEQHLGMLISAAKAD